MAVQKEEARTEAAQVREFIEKGQGEVALMIIDRKLEEMQKSSVLDWKTLKLAVKICLKTSEKGLRMDLLRRAEGFLRTWKAADSSAESLSKAEKWEIRTAVSLSQAFSLQKKYHKALMCLMKSLQKQAKGRFCRGKSELLIAISAFYMEVRSFGEAEKYAFQALTELQAGLKAGPEPSTLPKLSQAYGKAFSLLARAEQGLGHRQRSLQAYRTGRYIAKEHFLSPDKPTLSTSPRLSSGPNTPKDRYYSQAKLIHLHRKLTQKAAIPFLSTDQFFSDVIEKWLQEGQSSSPNRSSLTKAAADSRNDEERRKVAELRQRKHSNPVKSLEIRGKDHVFGEIRRLEDWAEKTKRRKKPIKVKKPPFKEQKTNYPPQSKPHLGLFFKPTDCQSAELRLEPAPYCAIHTSPQSVRSKDDFEQILSEVERDISGLNAKKRPNHKSRKGNLKWNEAISPACELAQSLHSASPAHSTKRSFSIKPASSHIEALALKLRKRVTIRKQPPSLSTSNL